MTDEATDDGALVPLDSGGVPDVIVKEPIAPEIISIVEADSFKTRANELVAQLKTARGSKELEMIDGIANLGIQAQRAAGSELNLLRVRVSDMLIQDGPGAEIAKDLIELRTALNQINPHELQGGSLFQRMFGWLPFIQNNPIVNALEKIAIRYEPVSKQVHVIETKLREGRAMLARDNIELRKLYEQVEEQMTPIQKNAYLGELVMQHLDKMLATTEDTLKKERLRSVLYDVSIRVQDLRTMEQVYQQFFVSIEMTRQNNTRLGQSVERTLSLATNVVTVGLAIQGALARQKRVMEANQRTQQFLGDLIAANAATIKQHTTEIGNVYNNPAIAMDKITQAHSDLMDAMDIADKLKQQGIESSRENIAKLSEMSVELHKRSTGLRESADEEVQSIEA